ncbi:MAG: hypothetical protein RAO92_10530 [Candidatus Euphemobacter frigidus]|nr:hypothetical protein [Candidatus Euphemobacter frigidus]MDP8276820.1 hypothetical protein [Candidatus Euphemobacter frigidus]
MRTTFPELLKKKITDEPVRPWDTISLINAGVTGYNAVQVYEWYKQQWQESNFNLVIYTYCCANDRTENRRVVADPDGDLLCYNVREYIPYFFNFPGQRILLRSSALLRLINTRLAPFMKSLGFQLKELNLDRTSATRDAVLKLRALCERRGARFLLVVIPFLRPEDREYRWIMDIVQSAGIGYLDLRPAFKEIGYDRLLISSPGNQDYVHPNQFGHEYMAELILKRIQRMCVEETKNTDEGRSEI